MKTRDKIFWLLWLAFVIALIWFCCHKASAADTKRIWFNRSGVYSPKGKEQIVPSVITVKLPSASLIGITTPAVYFAATAVDTSGFESIFSNEIYFTPDRTNYAVTLSWAASPDLDIDHYLIYRGSSSAKYTTNFNVGKALTATIPLYPPRPTNLVVILTTLNATNLQYRARLGQSWVLFGATNYTATNPPMRMWRAVGANKSKPPVTVLNSYWQ